MSAPSRVRRERKHNAQSAMEYLMTYGWAILIISVAVAVLYNFGVFNSGTYSTSASCVPSVGYFCSSPTLVSNGILIVSVGSIQTTTVTGIACSNSSAQPSTFTLASLIFNAGMQQ